MSKYIRTKDDRIVKVNVENGVYTSKYELIGKPKDTIEELLDCWVRKESGDFGIGIHYSIIYQTQLFNNILERLELIELSYAVYGAIWTEKGLIYVAKMNKKGELELL